MYAVGRFPFANTRRFRASNSGFDAVCWWHRFRSKWCHGTKLWSTFSVRFYMQRLYITTIASSWWMVKWISVLVMCWYWYQTPYVHFSMFFFCCFVLKQQLSKYKSIDKCLYWCLTHWICRERISRNMFGTW